MQTSKRRALWVFASILLVRSLLYLLVGLVEVPLGWIGYISVLISILFVGLPIIGLYVGASLNLKIGQWGLTALFGLVAQFGLARVVPTATLLHGIVFAISQAGLIVWCLGLGGFIASLFRDKNLLLPLAAFLAIFDFWLVFVPEGPVGQIARGNQRILGSMAYVVPKLAPVSHGGHAESLAYIGPADFMFLAMFFVALFRFNMRARETLNAILPVLVVYLLIVLFAGHVQFGPVSLAAMPALLPIGATVLIANRKEFKLSKDEKISTALIIVVGIGVVTWRMGLHWHDSGRLTAPLRQELGPRRKAPPNSLLQDFGA